MISHVRLETRASSIVQRYQKSLDAIESIFVRAIHHPNPNLEESYVDYRENIFSEASDARVDLTEKIILEFNATARDIDHKSVFDDTVNFVLDARQDAEIESLSAVVAAFEAQLAADRSKAQRAFFLYMTRVNGLAMSMSMSEARIRANNDQYDLGGSYFDRLGRRSRSNNNLLMQARHALYGMTNTVTIDRMVTAAVPQFKINNPTSKHHGSIFDVADYPTLISLMFYPGSTALVVPID